MNPLSVQTHARRRDQVAFDRARLHLTAWYVLTLAMIVLVFSGVLYGVASARLGSYRHEQEPPAERRVERETTAFALGELRIYLLLGNLALLALGVGGAYLLAGRTLQPIAHAMARQDRFTSDASHELRTPLTAIRSAVDVALQRDRAPASYRAVLAEINEEAEGMTALIDQLLWLARGGPPARPEQVDLRSVLDDVVRKTAATASDHGSTVELEPGAPMVITIDPVTLRLVLLNLTSNALQHTQAGTSVHLHAERAGSGIAFRISDNGPGIPLEERANVFQPFYRLETAGSEGHGLGLALVRELVTAAGGTIQIDDTPGGGSTVVVWIPQPGGDVTAEAKPLPGQSWRHPEPQLHVDEDAN